MTKAVKLLMDEHHCIKQVVKTCASLEEFSSVNDFDAFREKVKELLKFFRSYADRFHHRKEEDILFPEMVKRNEVVAGEIIAEMNEQHEEMRELLRKIEMALDKKEVKQVCGLFETYSCKLLDHIAVEDDELFQMTDTLFSAHEMENIYFRFIDADNELGNEEKVRWEGMVV